MISRVRRSASWAPPSSTAARSGPSSSSPCVALLLRTSYEYFIRYADVPWVQFWWSITYYNAWFMVVNDDPLVWFYYNWGFSTFPDRRDHVVDFQARPGGRSGFSWPGRYLNPER